MLGMFLVQELMAEYILCVCSMIIYMHVAVSHYAGVTAANSIAKWDGSNWLSLGNGLTVTTTSDPIARAMTFIIMSFILLDFSMLPEIFQLIIL